MTGKWLFWRGMRNSFSLFESILRIILFVWVRIPQRFDRKEKVRKSNVSVRFNDNNSNNNNNSGRNNGNVVMMRRMMTIGPGSNRRLMKGTPPAMLYLLQWLWIRQSVLRRDGVGRSTELMGVGFHNRYPQLLRAWKG